VKWTDLAQNVDKLQANLYPVIEPLISIKLRISCVGDKYRPKKDSTLWSSLIVMEFVAFSKASSPPQSES
jgi:hypothetical protein